MVDRNLARKARGEGANRAKARRKVARIYARITDRGRDHLHKPTTRLVRENQTLVIEDLTVRNMVKTRVGGAGAPCGTVPFTRPAGGAAGP